MDQFSLFQESESTTAWFFSVKKASAVVQTARLTINTLSIWSCFLSRNRVQLPYIAIIAKARSYDFIYGCVSFWSLYPRRTHCLQALRDFYTQVFLFFAFLYPRICLPIKTRKRNKHTALPGVVRRVVQAIVPTPLSCLKIVLKITPKFAKTSQQIMFIAHIFLFCFHPTIKSDGVIISFHSATYSNTLALNIACDLSNYRAIVLFLSQTAT